MSLTADHLKALRLDASATSADIRKAYKTLSRQYHPDRNPGNSDAEACFKQVNTAYEFLTGSDEYKQHEEEREAKRRGAAEQNSKEEERRQRERRAAAMDFSAWGAPAARTEPTSHTPTSPPPRPEPAVTPPPNSSQHGSRAKMKERLQGRRAKVFRRTLYAGMLIASFIVALGALKGHHKPSGEAVGATYRKPICIANHPVPVNESTMACSVNNGGSVVEMLSYTTDRIPRELIAREAKKVQASLGSCPQDAPAIQYYTDSRGQRAGQLLCYVTELHAILEWTSHDQSSQILRDDRDLRAAMNEWTVYRAVTDLQQFEAGRGPGVKSN